MKMTYDLLSEKGKKKVDDFLEECKNNKKGWDAKNIIWIYIAVDI